MRHLYRFLNLLFSLVCALQLKHMPSHAFNYKLFTSLVKSSSPSCVISALSLAQPSISLHNLRLLKKCSALNANQSLLCRVLPFLEVLPTSNSMIAKTQSMISRLLPCLGVLAWACWFRILICSLVDFKQNNRRKLMLSASFLILTTSCKVIQCLSFQLKLSSGWYLEMSASLCWFL